jgi:hypothetical protein
MAPIDRPVPRFAAEPPQDELPDGPWEGRLREVFLAACDRIDTEGTDLGEPGELHWFPDRTFNGRTFHPATARTSTGLELFGHVSYLRPEEDGEDAEDFAAMADFTEEIAERHPEWKLDLCDDVVDEWNGAAEDLADMTLVWGVPMVPGAAVATAVLGDDVVDGCVLEENRFTLLAPDGIGGSLEIAVADEAGTEIARELLYDPSDDEGEEEGS